MRGLPNFQLTSQLEGDIWSVQSGSERSELGLQSRGRAPRTQTKGELQLWLPQPAPGYRLLPAALFTESVGCLLSPSVCQAQPDHLLSSSSHSFSPDRWIRLWYEAQCVSHCPAFVGLEQRREWCRAPIAPKTVYPVSPGYSLCFPSRNQDAKNHTLFPTPRYKELCLSPGIGLTVFLISKSPHWKWLPGDPVHHSSHPLRELMST